MNSEVRSQGPRWPIRQPKKNWNALGQGISLITAQIQGSLEQTRMPVRRRARSTNPRASAHILGKHCKQGKIGRKKMQCCMSSGIVCSDELTDGQERERRGRETVDGGKWEDMVG